MIDTIEMIEKVFNVIPSSLITKYRITQPNTPPNEFIVINSLTLQGRQLQQGVLNVNIHVKNLKVPDGSQPNTKRLGELSKEITSLLNKDWHNGQLIDITAGGGVKRESNGYHYVNIKINYQQFNL